MWKQGVFVVAAIVSVLPLGCSGEKIVHQCRLGSYELRIIRVKEDLKNPQLYYEVIGPNGIVKHKSYLATQVERSFTLFSVVDKQAGIMAIVENYRPTVFVAAFDVNTLQAWPDRDMSTAEMSRVENRIAKHLASFTRRSGWRGGDIVWIEPVTFP
jgi:hypothetical protein